MCQKKFNNKKKKFDNFFQEMRNFWKNISLFFFWYFDKISQHKNADYGSLKIRKPLGGTHDHWRLSKGTKNAGGHCRGSGDLNTTKQDEKTTFLNSNKINQTNLRQ
jgi:hypothetical protein